MSHFKPSRRQEHAPVFSSAVESVVRLGFNGFHSLIHSRVECPMFALESMLVAWITVCLRRLGLFSVTCQDIDLMTQATLAE